jgi:AraC-like DNA-binding protein
MRDLIRLPSVTPELLLGSAPLPPPSGPIRYSLDDAPERERAALLQESFARLGFAYRINPLRDEPIEVDLALHALPGLQMLSGRLHGSRNQRTRAEVEDGTDDIGLIVSRKGQHLIAQGKHEIVLGDGEAAFVSLSDPSCFTHKSPGDLLALRFPRAQFAPLANGALQGTIRPIPRGAPALRLLTSYIGVAWDDETNASVELRHLVVAHVYDLMAVLIGTTRDAAEAAHGRGTRAARLHAIKQDIARSLDDPNLSVATLALRHGCTPRFIQRLFETEGTTLTEYVLAQRLARAHRLLSDPRLAGEKVSTVAFDAGFGDLSYFYRAFRRQYGASPSDVREQMRSGG